MREYILLILTIALVISCRGGSVDSKDAAPLKPKTLAMSEVQKPVVAGGFYPASATELQGDINKYLDDANIEPASGNLMGIVVPHAGYRYSGPVAAYGFKQLKGRQYDYVVVLAPSHHKSIRGAAVRLVKDFETPLGKIPVATDIVERLVKNYDCIVDDEEAYSKEHALEVELPFLQTVLKEFKLIPLIVGTHDPEILAKIAGSLNEEFIDKNVLFVISTDLSHYHPYNEAVVMDMKAMKLFTEEKFGELVSEMSSGGCEMCGFGPAVVMMNLFQMRGGGKIQLLKYANSGDTTGEKGKVVGYSAIAVISEFQLSEQQKKELLNVAATTLVNYVKGQPIPKINIGDPYLLKPGAPFVTLKRGGELRGCIGHIVAREPLVRAVQMNTIAAASEDPRFQPVKPYELADISIEISVLTPPQPVYDLSTIKVGRDGLIIENGMKRGVLLPQVPGEFGWDREEFLKAICRKAGLSTDAIQSSNSKLYRFQALVFPEKT